jgi:uncharacterized protein involved in exopolysaccharide biosynthesis
MEHDVNFYGLFEEIKKRKRLFVLAFLAVFIILTVALLLSPKKFTATSSFFFPLKQGQGGMGLISAIAGEEVGNLLGGGTSANLSNYAVAILEGRTTTDTMLKKYKDKVFDNLKKDVTMVYLRKEWGKVVRIEKTKDDIIEVRVTTKHPELSAKIANDYIDSYKGFAEKSVLTFAKQKRIYIEKQRDLVKEELQGFEVKLLKFQNTNKVLDIPEETKMLLSYFAEMQSVQTISNAQAIEAETRLKAVKDKLIQQAGKSGQSFNYPLLSTDPTVQAIYTELVTMEMDLAKKRETLTDENPEIKRIQNNIKVVQDKIKEKIATRLSSLKSSISSELIEAESIAIAANAKTNAFNEVISEIKKRMENLPELGIEYGRLYRDVTVKTKVLAFIELELEKARLEEAQEGADVQVLDWAVAPDYKSAPKYIISMIIILATSMLMALMAVSIPSFLEEQKRQYQKTAGNDDNPAVSANTTA